MLSMAYGIWLGLLRLGWILPLPWPDQLILHGPLMIGGFLGTLIGLERAIGIAKPWAFAAPVCSLAGVVVLVFGPPVVMGPLLITIASAIVVAVFVTVLRRQASMFAGVMLAGAACWSIGNVQWMSGAALYRVVFWWVAFLVLTIAGERLELNRVLRPTRRVRAAFIGSACAMLAGAAMLASGARGGAPAMGAGLTSMAAWLMVNDVARRTVRQRGLTRFMAACLLSGYAWLGVAGIVLLATGAASSPGTSYDAVLHAVFLGFVVSMVFGHAPIVFPAVLGVPLEYRPLFYVHLVVLHASVAMRLTGDFVDQLGRLRVWGGLANALAIGLFVAATASALSRLSRYERIARPVAGSGRT